MLHGWGMHSGVMQDFAERLAAGFKVTLIDLPGHGRSGPIADMSLQGMVHALLNQTPPCAHWVGWSLGAVLSLRASEAVEAGVRSITLMTGTPRFVAGEDWPGMEDDLLLQFARDLGQDVRQCLRRFLGLQVGGLEECRRHLKDLRTRLAECDPPDENALEAGLSILRTADLRNALARLRTPVLAILGRRDRLVPAAVGEAMRELNSRLELRIMDGATHLPFRTHRDETLSAVERFLLHHDG